MKLQLNQLTIEMGELSDLANHVSRRVYILSVKRRV